MCNQEVTTMKSIYVVVLAVALTASPMGFADDSSSASSASSAAGVPELDAGGAGLAFGLVLGVAALIRERRRRR